ncbi:zonadhesin-like [Phyllopteryx taeniolatus]|uniref:zonadhesin-like n=1 Tax=Phyllopteryx taeniolatus TaxID=161469 RepID=UPI002AD49CA4|nr:zonadhesin-like [Phyllopteryx taeniolatus]
MLGGFCTDLLVTLTLVFLTQTGTQCRAENDLSSITLPDWRRDSEYVTQCSFGKHKTTACDWTTSHHKSNAITVDKIESDALDQIDACLEFWYLAPPNGLKLRALLKSSTGLVEIWISPVLAPDSWRQVFVPLNIIESGTKVVLEAVRTMSLENQVTFNNIGVRRGLCGHQCDPNKEIWTDQATLCLCSDRKLHCTPSQCPKGQSCGPQIRTSREASNTGTCTIHSNTDCSTFDGVLFRFMAPCNYILAKTCSSSEVLSSFSVKVVNDHDENSSVQAVHQVIVSVGNDRVSLLKQQTHRVVVNGIWRNLPLSFSNNTVKIKSNLAAVVLETSFGLYVSYDNAGDVHITLPPTYSEEVCGLCGNFNHLREDDLKKPDGEPAYDATALANSWQSGQTNSTCETILVPHQCEPVEEAEYGSEQHCGSLLSSTGPFAACRSFLGAESYFRGCMNKMCSAHGDHFVLCETLQMYADICKDAGVIVPTWWNTTICSPLCGENSHYNSCAEGCPDVCSSQDIVGSCGSCEERCECDYGFKLSGGKCVPTEDCGCWHNGKHFEKGETILEGECVLLCQCMGDNNVQCTKMQCDKTEVCKVKAGVKGCFPIKPATCSVYGDPHYITFDGMAYDFQGGCSYTLATTCGRESSVHFTVTGHNTHPPLHNSTRSKLDAVTLQIEGLYLTLKQTTQVYENNSLVRLPYSTAASYGSVWVYKDNSYVVMETTFGLRMVIDGQNRFFFQVDDSYKYQLCGLCGTYSEQQDDDFIKPSGQNATDPFEFGDSWRAPHNNECVSHPNDPRPCENEEEEKEAYIGCFAILGDAFKPCHETIHPSIYIGSCVHDYCATSGNQHTLCESLKSYETACHVAGVELPYWATGSACAEPQTTENPPTPPTPTLPSQIPDPDLCPMNCDFEKNLCGWQQLIQDTFDWTRYSGATPSLGSGPNHDHTTGAGFYMYIEGDSVTHGDPARLLSSECHYSGPVCLHFWYHMHGSATAMALNMYLLQGNKATKIWSMKNNHGQEWHLGKVDINVSGPFQIIVEGIRGANALSDVAIDDISIQFGSCASRLGNRAEPGEVIPSDPVCSLNCSFDRNICSWNQMITDAFDWTWQSVSTPTLITGPSSDHTGDGHYLYIEASTVSHGDTARLISSECSASGPQCLQFWYHMYGSADTMGLHVYLLQGKKADAIWWKRNDQGNTWHLGQVDLKNTGAFQIIIEGRRGANKESDVAIDDVTLYNGQCSELSGVMTTHPPKPDANVTAPPNFTLPVTAVTELPGVNAIDRFPVATWPPLANVTEHPVIEATTNLILNNNYTGAAESGPPHSVCQLNCKFEKDLCQWNQLHTDVFDWTRRTGSTPTFRTGPSSDHTTGHGHYLYIEANSASHGDTARLISSECFASGPQCLQFWYHMYGSADTMGLHLYLLQDKKADPIWWKRNDQGNMWHLAEVDLTVKGSFQIIIEGRRGSNEESDVAIDDLTLYDGQCSELSGVTTTHPPKPESNETLPPSLTSHGTGITELPAVTVTDQLPATARPSVANATAPTFTEATTHVIMENNDTADAQPPHSVCQLNCNFEKALCQWNQLHADVFDWTRQSGSTPTFSTGPSSDHTTGHGHYLYIEANSASHGDTARLISSECSTAGPQCLQFWYHMYGSADTMGLHLYLVQDKKADAVWWKRNDQGNTWHLAEVGLTVNGSFQIIIEGRRGSSEESDVAIDDVLLFHGQCSELSGAATTHPPKPEGNATIPPSVTPQVTAVTELPAVNVTGQFPTTARPPEANATIPWVPEATTNLIINNNVTAHAQNRPPYSVCQLNCNFEKGLCQWNQLLTDVYDWTRLSGSTPTIMTGPSSDHTTGHGHYLYIEANSASHGDTARLISSKCSASGPQCLQFWYHMYGSAETMGLHVYLLQDKRADPISWVRNNQGNMWRLAQVDFTTTGSFQILFEGRRGSNDQSDVAIDDISLYSGHCSDLTKPTTLAPMTTDSVTTEGSEFTTENITVTQPITTSIKTTTDTTISGTKTLTPELTKPSNPNASTETPGATVTIEPQTTDTAHPSSINHPVDDGTEEPGPEPTTEKMTAPITYPQSTVTPISLTTESSEPTTRLHSKTSWTPETPTTIEPQTTARALPSSTDHPVDEGTEDPGPEPTTEKMTAPITYPQSTVTPISLTTESSEPTTRLHSKTSWTPETPTTIEPQTTARALPSSTDHPVDEGTEDPGPEPTTEKMTAPITYPQSTVTPISLTTESSEPTTVRPEPPTTELTPSCQQNSHYNTCIPACSPTCRYLNGPPLCNDNDGCESGCVCDDGYVLKRGNCVPIQQCGCVDGDGNKYSFGQVWYTKHCSQKCRCEREDDIGESDCDEEECDGNAVCIQNEEGRYYCQKTGFDECTINGDPVYRTFDNMKHDFEGEHSYVLVRTKNLPGNLQDVYIEGINTPIEDDDDDVDDISSEEDRDEYDENDDNGDNDSNEHEEHHRLQGLRIKVYNHTVEFKKHQKLFVDGQRTKTPVSPSLGLKIKKHSSHIYLNTDFGLSVKFDGRSDAEINLPRIYKRKVGGLCGNFDGRILNDRMKPDGTVAKTVQEFGESWRV